MIGWCASTDAAADIPTEQGEHALFRKQKTTEGDWRARTLSEIRQARWDELIDGLTAVRPGALTGLTARELRERIEGSWQAVPCKPLTAQQEDVALQVILEALPRQADCLSIAEHSLLERMLVEEGTAPVEDLEELEAAHALRHRLWADVGLAQDGDTSARLVVRLDERLTEPLREALSRPAHGAVRMRLFSVHATISGLLYIAGALDDRAPQQLFMQQVLQADMEDEEAQHLAQKYLWASYDCVDYPHGVLLVHPALADPAAFVTDWEARPEPQGVGPAELLGGMQGLLPQEAPLDEALSAVLRSALRPSQQTDQCVSELRLLAKQGAPLEALHHVLSTRLCVLETADIRRAVRTLWEGVPRWEGVCTQALPATALQ